MATTAKSFTYTLCKKLIEAKRTTGLQDKMDVYLANDRLTADEYTDLVGQMGE